MTKPRPTLENEWEDVQTIGAPVVSVIKFFRAGLTTRGQVEIGGDGWRSVEIGGDRWRSVEEIISLVSRGQA